jgi:LPXTG-motif cell wall-anchored protein
MEQIARAIGDSACALGERFVPLCKTGELATIGYLMVGLVVIAATMMSIVRRRS